MRNGIELQASRQMIQLKGELDSDIKALGIEAGDTMTATVYETGSKSAHVTVSRQGNLITFSVWPDNYNVVDNGILQ